MPPCVSRPLLFILGQAPTSLSSPKGRAWPVGLGGGQGAGVALLSCRGRTGNLGADEAVKGLERSHTPGLWLGPNQAWRWFSSSHPGSVSLPNAPAAAHLVPDRAPRGWTSNSWLGAL